MGMINPDFEAFNDECVTHLSALQEKAMKDQ
jgi:hypothetical protein